MITLATVPQVPEPDWLGLARTYLGEREVPGIRHNSNIIRWLELLKSRVRDDETAWCAAYVGGVFEMLGIESTRSLAARSYLDWGVKLDAPAVGCVVVFWRGRPDGWSGHVGFVVGVLPDGRLWVLGGNQGDAVSIAPFDTKRVLGYRAPKGQLISHAAPPVYAFRDQEQFVAASRLGSSEDEA